MAYSLPLFVTTLPLIISLCYAQSSFRPRALVLPVTKDAPTQQYVTVINQRTPLVAVKLAVHLGGQYLWVDCENHYVSSSYRPARCGSAQCSLNLSGNTACGDCSFGKPTPRPGCNNNTCGVNPVNSFINSASAGELAEDVISILLTDGSNLGRSVKVPRFLFACAPTFLIEGLASGATGLAGLGRGKIGIPSLFSAAFSFRRQFAICLSSSNGVIIFGDSPYNFLHEPEPLNAAAQLSYTPLFVNPVSTTGFYSQDQPSPEYFIKINSVRINHKPISINTTLLTIDGNGNGGTKISTVNQYSLLQTSIYKAFASAFTQSIAGVHRVAAVAPFEFCYSSRAFGSTRVGPGVPAIELVLEGGAVWTIFGSNSMVEVNDDVLCLGLLDGGANPMTAVVIGAHQFEDNLLQFDLARSRLGFTGTLLFSQTTCSNFNFTSNT